MNFIEFWHCAKASLQLTTVAGVQTRPWYILHVLLVWITIPNFQEFSWSTEKSVQFCIKQRYRYNRCLSPKYLSEMNFIEFWHCAKASLQLTTVAGVQTRPWYILHVLLVWITIPNFQEFSWSTEKSVQFCSEQRYRYYRYTISSFRIKLWAWQLAMMGSE